MRAMLCVCALLAGAPLAAAEPLDQIVRDRIGAALPGGLDVGKVHLPPSLAQLDVDPAQVAIEVPRALRAGRRSIKLIVPGRPAQFVPISIAAVAEVAIVQRALAPGAVITAADVVIEQRAVDGAAVAPVNSVVGAVATRALPAGAPIGRGDVALPPPVSRGAPISVEIRRGSVRVRGPATLELAARIGEPATARLAHTRAIVRGTLVAADTLVVTP